MPTQSRQVRHISKATARCTRAARPSCESEGDLDLVLLTLRFNPLHGFQSLAERTCSLRKKTSIKLTGNQSSHLKSENRTTHNLESPAIQGSGQPLSRDNHPEHSSGQQRTKAAADTTAVRLPGGNRANEHTAHTSRHLRSAATQSPGTTCRIRPPPSEARPGACPFASDTLETQAGRAELGNVDTKPAASCGPATLLRLPGLSCGRQQQHRSKL